MGVGKVSALLWASNQPGPLSLNLDHESHTGKATSWYISIYFYGNIWPVLMMSYFKLIYIWNCVLLWYDDTAALFIGSIY